jgi:hypothetical protein
MSDLLERMDGPEFLTGFEPDPDAMAVLADIGSETAARLRKRARKEWVGYHSTETYLAPLAQAGGEILLRFINTPGSEWVWWRGQPIDQHHYGRMHTLPHYHDHKATGRRSGHPDRIADFVERAQPIPVHVENVPASVWEFIENDRPYERFEVSGDE